MTGEVLDQRWMDALAEFAASLPDNAIENDQSAKFDRSAWQACAVHGLIGMAIPEAFGGTEAGGLESGVAAMETMGAHVTDLGLVFGLSAQMWTVMMPILEFGTDEQKKRFLPGLCDGSTIGCHALTEPDAGSDIFSLSMLAEPCEGGYRLNGKKHLITLGPICDLALVFATTDPSKGRWGVNAFVVETGSTGFRQSASKNKMGLRTVPIGDLEFEDCYVPESNRLGADGAGFWLAQKSLEYDRCCILAAQLGVMRRQLDRAVAYARSRKQFDQPIGKFQSVSNRVADMKLRLETSRLLLREVAALKAQGKPSQMESAMLKLHLSESFLASSTDSIRIHGGTGFLTETGVERDLRDAMGGVLYAGTSDIQRNIIAGLLGL